MDDDKINKIENVFETSLGLSGILASSFVTQNPEFSALPIVVNIICEVFAGLGRYNAEKRMQKFQSAVDQKGIPIEQLREALSRLEEHDQYVVWNNLKFLCTDALPEVTDALIDSIIAFLMDGNNRAMNEELCEILRECNATDIELLYLLKDIKGNTDLEDILWEEFVRQIDLSDTVTASDILNKPEFLNVAVGKTKCPYLIRALSKMQNLGVIEMKQFTTTGSINPNNISSIHITVFGMKLMEHLRPLDKVC